MDHMALMKALCVTYIGGEISNVEFLDSFIQQLEDFPFSEEDLRKIATSIVGQVEG